jgi:RNA-directed DNA polymerase
MNGSEEAEAGGSVRRAGAGDSGRNPQKAAPGASGDPSGKDKAVAQDQQLIEELIERDNLNRAWRQVRRNRGSPGVDGRDMDQTQACLKEHWEAIKGHLLAGTYRPKPVKRVEIPKPGGGTRLLGVPTILDRFIQQAALQVLTPIFEPQFSEHSYGFRPGRSAHEAIKAAQGYQQSGKGWVVDLDLKAFFDEVNHDLLMARVRRHVKDKRMLKLIRAFLKSGVLVNGITETTEKGTPQGGPLSPLLSNIMLNDLDHELEKRGHCFCRYADDCNIYVGTERSGQRVLESIMDYVEKKLKLKVNRDKSAVDRPSRRTFLGYSFTAGKEPKVRVPKKSVQKIKSKIKQHCRKGRGQNLKRFIAETLNPVLRGWTQYFRLSETKTFARELDEWIRHRLRCILWRQWKRPKTRQRKLRALGLSDYRAWKGSVNGRGPWLNSGSHHMNIAVPIRLLSQWGLVSVFDHLMKLRTTSD